MFQLGYLLHEKKWNRIMPVIDLVYAKNKCKTPCCQWEMLFH